MESRQSVHGWALSSEEAEAEPSSDREMETEKRPPLTIGHLPTELLSMWRKSRPHYKENGFHDYVARVELLIIGRNGKSIRKNVE